MGPQWVRSRVHLLGDHSTDRGAGGLIGIGPQMPIGVERGAGGGVAHPGLHSLDVRARGDQQRRQVMP